MRMSACYHLPLFFSCWVTFIGVCMSYGPDPSVVYPIEGLSYHLANERRTVFLQHVVKRKNILVGEYTYFDDPEEPEQFETKNVLYHYPFSQERLIIGKFCALAQATTFIMAGANHKLDGFSTYPFGIFQRGWEKDNDLSKLSSKGDTVVGNDVWFGYGCTILPGVHIGDGAIIAARAVVTKDVPPYVIVGGNPAKILRHRFDAQTVQELLLIRWWDWPREKISRNIKAIVGADLQALQNAV